jgi:CubicO group peptidase (beta-lactamase class C family)
MSHVHLLLARWAAFAAAGAVCLGCAPAPVTPASPATPVAATVASPPPAPAVTTPPPVTPETAREPIQVDKETPKTTAWGARYLVPASWFVQVRPDHTVVADPDRELTLVIAEIEGDSVLVAPEALFRRLGRDLPATERNRRHQTATGGWDEVLEASWETPVDASSVLAVNIRRKGRRMWATLLEGKQAAFARRGAQVRLVVGGLKPPGFEEEDLSRQAPRPLRGETARAFAAFIEEARRTTQVPGMAVAVVQGGEVVFARGFGSRTAGRNEPVTPRTRFMIGSVTKSLSSLLLARLVDEGKLRWDSPVATLLPGFATGDRAFTEKLRVADTFCACTGMPRRDLDFIFEFARTRPDDIIAWFRDTRPTTGFGETFQYSNQMTAVGGYLAARLDDPRGPLEAAYVRALERRVLRPLGMNDSTASFQRGQRGAASPHSVSLASTDLGEAVRLPWSMESFVRPLLPAGGVFSTAEDMARYALFELRRGRSAGGQQVVSENNLLERRRPRIQAGPTSSYGLGLGISRRNGLTLVSHDGGTFGFVTRFLVIPERDLGLVVLTNSSGAGSLLLDAISQRLMELVLGARPRAAVELERGMAERLKEGKKTQAEARRPVPPEVAARLAGRWRTERLGEIRIAPGPGGGLVLDAGEWKSRLGFARKPDGTELIFLLDPPLVGMPLRLVTRDGRLSLVIDFGQDVFRFRRV